MTAQNRSDEGWKQALDVLNKFLMPFIIVVLGWGYTYMNKLEERVYVLQSTAVTEQKLAQTESRIMNYLDIRLSDLNSKLDLIIKGQELQDRYNRAER